MYPHIEELKSYIISYKTEFERLTKNTHKFLKNDKFLTSISTNFKEDKESLNDLIRKEMVKFTEHFLLHNSQGKETRTRNKSNTMINSQTEEKMKASTKLSHLMLTSHTEEKMKQSKMMEFDYDNLFTYDASEFANMLGLPKNELTSEDILNLILYCSFDLQINCK